MNEVSEGKLARLALVGAIALGVAAGNAAQVSNREINNWKRDFNSLTIKDKKKVLGMIDVKEGKNPVAKNINKFNKPKTFTDRKKRDKRGYEKHKGKKLIMGQKDIEEKLSPSHGIKAYIDDFQKSDAPQFQGKSAEKRRDMAIAAYLGAKRGTNEEVEQVEESLDPSVIQKRLHSKTGYRGVAGRAATIVYMGNVHVGTISHKTGNVSSNDKEHKTKIHSAIHEKLNPSMEGFGALDESQKLANKRTELRKKMFGDTNYLSPAQRKELDKAAKAELKKEREAKKAAPKAKTTTKTAKGKTHTGSAEAADKHIIMQMRKAQDYGAGKHPIRVSPTRTVKVPHTLINKALEKHDAMGKPEAKRTFRIQLIKALRKAGK